MKRQNQKGRCLHFNNGMRCNQIISAHSIQKSGQLKLIEEAGHVYRLNGDTSTLKKNGGQPNVKAIGVNNASTFFGMCQEHDNQLFSPIDNHPLRFDHEQVALYAYRSVCREYFVKENATITLAASLEYPELQQWQLQLLQAMLHGQRVGLQRLQRHKLIYDDCLARRDFSKFKFTIFGSSSRCSLQASGLTFPVFDFQGREIQDLSPEAETVDLLTFFTAPTANGWAFVVAWHESSEPSCQWLIHSLAEARHRGNRLEDMLLRLSLSSCENHAIRISWWESLASNGKDEALDLIRYMADPRVGIRPDYLVRGCAGLADWSFNSFDDAH
ncbi:hypothetical protein AL062_13110 [Pseudomonas syringae pv. syringae]|nr:hypothetical protein AL062_13110 [Pseudomonas syringae pv. syringae]